MHGEQASAGAAGSGGGGAESFAPEHAAGAGDLFFEHCGAAAAPGGGGGGGARGGVGARGWGAERGEHGGESGGGAATAAGGAAGADSGGRPVDAVHHLNQQPGSIYHDAATQDDAGGADAVQIVVRGTRRERVDAVPRFLFEHRAERAGPGAGEGGGAGAGRARGDQGLAGRGGEPVIRQRVLHADHGGGSGRAGRVEPGPRPAGDVLVGAGRRVPRAPQPQADGGGRGERGSGEGRAGILLPRADDQLRLHRGVAYEGGEGAGAGDGGNGPGEGASGDEHAASRPVQVPG